MSLLVSTFAQIQIYLESGQADREKLEELLLPLLPYLDKSYPYFLFVKEEESSWLVTIIATYYLDDKRTSVELVAYLDHKVVRFLRSSSCLKLDVPVPPTGLAEERVVDYFSERQTFDISGYNYPQRLLYLTDKLRLLSSHPLREILDLLDELLVNLPYRKEELNFALDELLLILDTSTSQDFKWLRKIKLRTAHLGELIEKPIDRRHLVRISLLLVIPELQGVSRYLSDSFQRLLDQVIFLSELSLNFMTSLLQEIESAIAGETGYKISSWEKAFRGFFKTHQDKCFVGSSQAYHEVFSPKGITTTSPQDLGITSSD